MEFLDGVQSMIRTGIIAIVGMGVLIFGMVALYGWARRRYRLRGR